MLTGYLIGCTITAILMLVMIFVRRNRMERFTVGQHVGYTLTLIVLWPLFLVILILDAIGIIEV